MFERIVAKALAGLLIAAGASAQEPEASEAPVGEEAEEQDVRAEPPTYSIRVLQHPYDIASFYRARPRGEEYGFFAGEEGAERYPIAGFYRAGGPRVTPYGYSRFWMRGYGRGRSTGLVFPYRQTIGQNGDLYLFAPTVLATVGPLTGVFAEGR
jgi:hypothetical protein